MIRYLLMMFIVLIKMNICSGQFMNSRLTFTYNYMEFISGSYLLKPIEDVNPDNQKYVKNAYSQLNDCNGKQKLILSLEGSAGELGLRNADFRQVEGYGQGDDALFSSLFYTLDKVVMRPLPGSNDTVIIFHPFITFYPNYSKTDWGYTLVDMKANNGKGKVILYNEKFAEFYSPACTVMSIPNSADFWFLSGYDSVTVRAFKVSKNGVDTQYVQSRAHNQTYRQASINSNFMGNNRSAFQYPGNIIMTPLHDGSGVLISALRRSSINGSAIIEYDFDPVNGTLSKPRTILRFQELPENTMQASSAILSPNDTFVYATCESRRLSTSFTNTRYLVYQINRFTGDKQVYLSGIKYHQEQINEFTHMYNAPDGKIYLLKRVVIGRPKITHMYDQMYCFERPNLAGKYAALRFIDTVSESGSTVSRDAPWSSRPWPYFTANSQMNACADTTVFTLGGDTALHQLVLRFGDGDSALVQGPVPKGLKIKHHYKQNGRYPVALITWNTECNVPLWATDTLDILKPPHSITYSFTHRPGCQTDTITLRFRASNHNRFRFQWPGYDSLMKASDSQLIFHYPRSGGKSLFAFISGNADCVVTLRDTLQPVFHPLPQPRWLASGFRNLDKGVYTACQPFVFSITDSTADMKSSLSGSDYANTRSTGLVHTLALEDTGRYRLWMETRNTYGCSATDTFHLNALHSPFAVRLATDSIVCAGQQPLRAQWQARRIPAGTIWNLSDGGISSTNLQWNRLYMTPGTYSLRLTGVAGNQCAYADTLRFGVSAAIPATFTLQSNRLCAEKQTIHVSDTLTAFHSWWNTNGLDFSGDALGNYRYSGSGNRQLTRYTLSDQGCRDSFMRQVTVLALPEMQLHWSDTALCRPGNMMSVEDRALNITPARYVWFDGRGGRTDTLAESFRLRLHWPMAGTYATAWVKFHASGCSDTAFQTLRIHSEPLANLHIPDPLCADRTMAFGYTLKAGSAISGQTWALDGNTDTARSISRVFSNTGQIRLQLELRNTDACSTRYDTLLYVGRAPEAQMQVSRVSAEADASTFYFAASGNRIKRYHWNFGRGTADTAGTSIPGNRRYQGSSGTYQVRLIVVSEDGCADTLNHAIALKPLLPLYWPNSFTPDGDGLNDRFEISGTGDVLQYRLRIFYRWGGQLFDSRDHSVSWDGTFKGEPVPEGVFPFLLEVQTIDGRWHRIHDRVQLIRNR